MLGSLLGVHLGMPLQQAPSEGLHWWLSLITVSFSFGFLLGSFIGVYFGLPPWLAPLEVLLGGLLFWIYRLGSSMISCVYALILLKGLQVLDYVVHILYLVRHDKLHPWKTSVAYEMFGKKLYCVWYLFCSCIGGVWFLTPVVFHFLSYVPYIFSMWSPRCTIFFYVVYNYSCSRWG